MSNTSREPYADHDEFGRSPANEISSIEVIVDLTLRGFERGHGDLRGWRTRVLARHGLRLHEIGGSPLMSEAIEHIARMAPAMWDRRGAILAYFWLNIDRSWRV